MRTIYRLYTERRPNLAELASRYFDGFTLLDGTGYYQGKPEPSTTIEIIAEPYAGPRVFELASLIQRTNGQTTVLVTRQSLVGTVVTANNSVEVA